MAEKPLNFDSNGVPERPSGRVKGQSPRYGRNLRDLIFTAMDETGWRTIDKKTGAVVTKEEGALGYLKWAAVTYPEKFLDLVKASMPKDINFSLEHDSSALLATYLRNPEERREKIVSLARRFELEMKSRDSIELEAELVATNNAKEGG